MPEVLLTPAELAALCQVPVGTVYRWNYHGTGPRPIRVGKHCRYRQTDVDAWLDAQTTAERRPA